MTNREIKIALVIHVKIQLMQLILILSAAEERRKYPPYKAISVVHNKQRQHYLTNKAKPKLLPDRPGKVALSHYAVT